MTIAEYIAKIENACNKHNLCKEEIPIWFSGKVCGGEPVFVYNGIDIVFSNNGKPLDLIVELKHHDD
jgi:hypothetical protein